jgi:hypothetical protein
MYIQVKKANKSRKAIKSVAQKRNGIKTSLEFKDNRDSEVVRIREATKNTSHIIEDAQSFTKSPIQLQKEIVVHEKLSQWLADSQNPKGKEYKWESNFHIYIPENESDPQIIQCVIYIDSQATDKVISNWQEQINDRWNYKFALKTKEGKNYPITVQIYKDPDRKDYVIENIASDKAKGKRGLFGTESMVKWGEKDSQDIAHEVGHMLGNKDEYGKVWNGKEWVDFGYADKPGPAIEKEGSVMSRGDQPVRQRHFELILSKVEQSGFLGTGLSLILITEKAADHGSAPDLMSELSKKLSVKKK